MSHSHLIKRLSISEASIAPLQSSTRLRVGRRVFHSKKDWPALWITTDTTGPITGKPLDARARFRALIQTGRTLLVVRGHEADHRHRRSRSASKTERAAS